MKTTHIQLEHRERALAGMRASQLGVSLTEYVTRLIQRDADEAGLTKYLDEPARIDRKEVARDRR